MRYSRGLSVVGFVATRCVLVTVNLRCVVRTVPVGVVCGVLTALLLVGAQLATDRARYGDAATMGEW